MRFKKGIFIIALMVLVSTFAFSQVAGIGLTGTYNPNNPSLWSTGIMLYISEDVSSGYFRSGVSFGEVTMTYEQANPYTSTHEMTEYWRKGFYWDVITGGGYQIIINDYFGLRFGGDLYVAVSPVWIDFSKREAVMFNAGLTGLAGLSLLPNRRYYVHLDVCPGFTIVDKPESKLGDKFAFILPIRLTVGLNLFDLFKSFQTDE